MQSIISKHPEIKSIKIDYTTLAAWRTCPQKFVYRYLMSLTEDRPSPALEFGKLMHRAVELLNTQSFEAAIEILCNETTTHNLPLSGRRSLDHLFKLVRAYHENYFPDPIASELLEIKATAKLGHTPQGIEVYYCGTIDGVLDRGDKIDIIERKTTSWLGESFLNRMNPSAQATGYVYLAGKTIQKPIDRIIYDGISTAGYKDGILSTKAALFMRAETSRSEEAIAEWRTGVLRDVDRLVEDVLSGTASRSEPDACGLYNTTCPYINLCRSSSAARPALINNTMLTDPWPSFDINYDPTKEIK